MKNAVGLVGIVAASVVIYFAPYESAPFIEWPVMENTGEVGLEVNELAALTDYMKTQNTQSMQVSVGGEVVYTYGDVTEVGYLASVRKSVLAIMYGKYVADGTITLDATLEDLGMDDEGGLLESEKQATVRDLISARSGIYHPAANGGDSSADAPPRGSQPPGT
ncbi:MAG: serine hydrolase, partial [Sphingomonadales bacterium]|nr:serine hydrolase [Sphingomonadales bacterium]